MSKAPELKLFGQSAYIFDLDGTLFDSATQICTAVNSTRKVLGYPPLAFHKIRKLIGLPAEELFGDLNLESATLERVVNTFRIDLTKEVRQENPLFPGSYDLLSKLKGGGAFIGAATSKPQELAELVIFNSELNGLFDHIQGTGMLRPKPHADTILACIERSGLKRAVMIGDRIEDILAGNIAGIVTIGVAQSTHTPKMLFEAGAHHVFKSLLDLYRGVDKLPLESVRNREVF
jgi:phosphoglycolate phosphatase